MCTQPEGAAVDGVRLLLAAGADANESDTSSGKSALALAVAPGVPGNVAIVELLLRAGALPAPLTILEERSVGPGLGADSIAAGKIASIVGMITVVVFMVVVYGIFGLMADVALVGYPNVGKSTLISRISAAKPRIADYPFTTLEPNLGVVRSEGCPEFVVADIPGLIEGASEGRGLGHRFLRHVERARVLLVLVDLAPTALEEPIRQLEVILGELRAYQPELLERPRLVVGSRADVAEAGVTFDGDRLSAVTGEGLESLVHALGGLVEIARSAPVSYTHLTLPTILLV